MKIDCLPGNREGLDGIVTTSCLPADSTAKKASGQFNDNPAGDLVWTSVRLDIRGKKLLAAPPNHSGVDAFLALIDERYRRRRLPASR